MQRDRAAPRHPSDGGGTVHKVDGPDTVGAGELVSLGIELVVGPAGIATGGAITLLPSPFWGWSPPQAEAPGAPGWTIVTGPEGAGLVTTAVDGMLIATVRGRPLVAGERVRFDYGAEETARADRFAERCSAIWVTVDGDGDGVRAVIPEPVTVTVTAGPPDRVIATLPSAVAPGTTVTLHLASVDAVGNAFGGPATEVALTGTAGLELPATARLDDAGLASVPVTPRAPGLHRVSVRAPDGRTFLSNPMVVRDGVLPILWADLQIHSALSDGTGEPDELYRYAREVAALDVAAVTDHDHWGMRFLDASPELRARIETATEAANVPGTFVAVHGFEWTSWVHGHRHVLGFEGPIPWWSSLDPATDAPAELAAAARGLPVLIVRHHPAGGPVAIDWSFPVDPVLEPVVEVASVHGQSESPDLPGPIYDAVRTAFVDVQLAKGARFGLVGSTDGHDGHPGLSQLAGGAGGLTAIEGAEATRASVHAALLARRVYATNGPRIVLRVTAGGQTMGSVLPARPVEVEVRVVGTAPIDRIELVGRAGVVGSRRGEGTVLFATFPLAPVDGDLVYVRVVQTDGGLAWSSPIFFGG